MNKNSEYYDINSWEPRFHEAERSLIKFYQTRDTTCLKPGQELLDDFKDEHLFRMSAFYTGFPDLSNTCLEKTKMPELHV